MRQPIKLLALMAAGGLIYIAIELICRGHTHWTMFIVGGVCFVLVGGLNEWFPWEMSIVKQMFISALVITAVEFVAGLILNVWLGLGIWDYSNMPFNILGQICLPFTGAWFLLSLPAIVVDDLLRWKLFGERFPEYHFFSVRESNV